ncbi:PAS domain-containing protein [Tepidimonas sp. HKU77]
MQARPGPWHGGLELPQSRLWLQATPWHTHDERTGYVIALTDLTALRHAEQARLELQARLSALTDALHEAVLLHDPGRGRLVYASHRLLEWLPAPLAPADNLASLIEAIDPADQGRVLACWHDERKNEWTQRYRLRTPDGQWRHVQERASRVSLDPAGPRLVAASLLDVTDMVALEAREHEARARLQAVWDNPSIGVVVCDPQGTIAECNRALAIRLAADDTLLRGSRWLDWIHPDDRDAIQ